jgi:hypothetical protein
LKKKNHSKKEVCATSFSGYSTRLEKRRNEMEYEAINPLSEEDRARLICLGELTSMDSPGCESGFTLETDGVIWRCIAWENGTSIYEMRGYGDTAGEAMKNCLEFEDTADLDALERLDAEWDARRGAIYGEMKAKLGVISPP